MRTIDELSALVRARGGKVTSQRLVVWNTLVRDTTHPTVDDLYERLRPQLPGMSVTTLYNILNELVAWGEVRRFDTGDGSLHYDPNMRPHAELVCMRCHSVVDAPVAEEGAAALPTEIAGYRILTRSEQYLGFCPDCRAALDEHMDR